MTHQKIAVKRMASGAGLKLPSQAHYGDAGYDLRSTLDVEIGYNDEVTIPTGFSFEIPLGWVGLAGPRSGLGSKFRMKLANTIGFIDATYRGEIILKIINGVEAPLKIRKGDAIAQLVIVPCLLAECVEVDMLSDTVRGAGGFGSTGR